MNRLFEKTNVNSIRQFELDVARGLAVLFMIAVHVLQMFSNNQLMYSTYGEIIGFLGGPPAAPVFMFLLGAGIIYSKNSKPPVLLKRGIIILLSGYLLNFLRGTLPSLIGYFFSKDSEFLSLSYLEFISVDILQFAGLAFVYFAIVKKYKLGLAKIMLTVILFCLLNFLLSNIKIENPLVSAFSSLLWGSGEDSYFPFLSWIVYPIAGYCFGSFLIRCVNKKRFYLILFALGLTVFLTSGLIILKFLNIDIGLIDEYAYYHHNILGSIVFLSFVITWIGLLFFVSKGVRGIVKSTLARWSKNVSSIYFIHWVIIGNLTIFIGMNNKNLLLTIILTIFIVVVSDVMAIAYSNFKKKEKA